MVAYRQRDRSILRVLEPAFSHTHGVTGENSLSSQRSREAIRSSDPDSQERGVPVLGTVGEVVHQADGLSTEAVRFALGEDGGQGRDGLRTEELTCLDGSLPDSWDGVGGHIGQGDLHGRGKDGEGSKKEEGNSEVHFYSVIWVLEFWGGSSLSYEALNVAMPGSMPA